MTSYSGYISSLISLIDKDKLEKLIKWNLSSLIVIWYIGTSGLFKGIPFLKTYKRGWRIRASGLKGSILE